MDVLLRQTVNPISLPSLSAIVILNDTILWTGNFGKRNRSDPLSGPPNEYTIYRSGRHGHQLFSLRGSYLTFGGNTLANATSVGQR